MQVEVPVVSSHPGNGLTPVNDVEIVFNGLHAGSSFSSLGDTLLFIDIDNADIEGSEEYFNIYDENNVLLGKTNPSATQCSSSSTQLSFTQVQFEEWIRDGVIRFMQDRMIRHHWMVDMQSMTYAEEPRLSLPLTSNGITTRLSGTLMLWIHWPHWT